MTLPKDKHQQKHIYWENTFIDRKGVFLDASQLLSRLRKSKFSWAVYVPLAVLLNVGATLSGSCLAAVLVGVGTFGLPFLLGVRGLGTLLKMGTLILVLSGIIMGTLITYYLFNQEFIFEGKILDGTDLQGGKVTPYVGDENTKFSFTVRYTGEDAPENVTLYVNITKLTPEKETSHVLNGSGDTYYYNTTLQKDIYNYRFAVFSNTTGGWNETGGGLGPVASPFTDVLVQQWMWGILVLFIPGGLFFYMIVLLYNSRKRAQEEEQKRAEEEKEIVSRKKVGEEEDKKRKTMDVSEYECTECGADVPVEASFCPKCGEPFEEDEEDAPGKGAPEEDRNLFECTECGGDVPGDAEVCPHCGEPFEEDEGEPTETQLVAKEVTDELQCTECGADVPGDTTVCPSCGEDFDEPLSGKYMCTECGADVPGDSNICPSCGERFDEKEDGED